MKRLAAIVLSGIALSTLAAGAPAQQYPSRPIRFIVPFPPGGGNDVVGRIIALKLNEALGQPVVVDNRGGGGGTIGIAVAAKAPADGYTMVISNLSMAMNASLYSKLPYDTLKDLAPITVIGRQPSVLVASPSMPAKSVREFLALARAKPGQINYGSSGTASYLAMELVALTTHIRMLHVPYKGLGPELIDLLAGRVQVAIATIASTQPHLKSGKLRALAVTTMQRTPLFPEVPAMDEAGVPGYDYSTWYELFVPAGTPMPIITRLNGETARILASPVTKAQFSVQGLEATPSSAEQARSYLESEVAKWARVIKASGAQVE
jgi:tripartite-type tricarboxylate transporter receptor subunit TctC